MSRKAKREDIVAQLDGFSVRRAISDEARRFNSYCVECRHTFQGEDEVRVGRDGMVRHAEC